MTATSFFLLGLVCITQSLSVLAGSAIRMTMLGAALRKRRPDIWALQAVHRPRWLVRLVLGRAKLDVPGDDGSRHLSSARFWMHLCIFDWIVALAAFICWGAMGAPNILDWRFRP